MKKIDQYIKICNKMYMRQIKKTLKTIKMKDGISESCINNLELAGTLLIDVIKEMENGKTFIVLPCTRNIYETTLKAIVLDDNDEIMTAYNNVITKNDKNGMSKVRKLIANDFDKYFNCIKNDNTFNTILGEGILTYVYNYLCRYSHATKVNEFFYLAQKNEGLKKHLDIFINVFLIYPIIYIYIDAVCTKFNNQKINREISTITGIIVWNIMSMLQDEEKENNDLANLSKEVFGNTDGPLKIRNDKEKEFMSHLTKENEKTINENTITMDMVNDFCKRCTRKIFSKKEQELLYKIKLL